MDLKHELELWKETAISRGYEFTPTGSASWRLILGEGLFVEVRTYHEPDDMTLSGSPACIERLQQVFHCAMLNSETIQLTKGQVGSRIEELCEHQLNKIVQKFDSHSDVLLKEGGVRQMQATKHERNPELRKKCIINWCKIHGGRISCAACDMSFVERYGEIGDGYIEVHHLLPISQAGDEHLVDPKKDLVPLCANCHAMIHRLMLAGKKQTGVELEGVDALNKLCEFMGRSK